MTRSSGQMELPESIPGRNPKPDAGEHAKMGSLSEYEEWLRAEFKRVQLIGEIRLDEHQWRDLGQLLGAELKPHTKAQIYRRILTKWPATFASLLVFGGVFGYREGSFWPGIQGHTGLTKRQISDWGEAFEEIIRQYRLEPFDDMPGLRFVAVILAHGGIPNYCLSDFFGKVLLKAITDPWYADLSTRELIDAILDQSNVQLFVDKPVQRFLEYGGKVAVDFFSRTKEMAERFVDTHEFPNAQQFGLPYRIGEAFAVWASEQESLDPARPLDERVRLREPRIMLDPWGDGISIHLPSQEIPAKDSALDFTWKLYLGSELADPVEFKQKSRKIGLDHRIDERRFTLDLRPASIAVQLLFGSELRRSWRLSFFDRERPLLAFDAETSEHIPWKHAIPAESIWLVFPRDAQIEFEGEEVFVEEFPGLPGSWSDFQGGEWGLEHVSMMRFLQGAEAPVPIAVRPSHKSNVPLLRDAEPFPFNQDPDDVAIYVGAPPRLLLPTSGRQPQRDGK